MNDTKQLQPSIQRTLIKLLTYQLIKKLIGIVTIKLISGAITLEIPNTSIHIASSILLSTIPVPAYEM